MKIIYLNGFNGFYVVSKCKKSFDGLKFHYWAETVNECEKWIEQNDN